MKFGLLIVLALTVGSLAAHFLLADNGYVLINFRGYTIEMSVPVLAFLLFLFYLLARLVARIWHAPRQIGEAAARARARRAGDQVTRGFAALSQGKIARGERLLTKSARKSEMPLLQYLAAARAAQMQGDRARRDGWLKMAYEQDEHAANAVLLTQAELQLADGEYEHARASLNRILDSAPDHPEALKLLAELYYRDEEWEPLAGLLPRLRRHGNLPADRLDQWTAESTEALLDSAADLAQVDMLWRSLPRLLRKEKELALARTRALVRLGEADAAEAEIRKQLRANWDGRLALLYGDLATASPDAQLRHVESWLRDRPDDPDLLLTAGRLCTRSELWGKARSYLESSIAIRPTPRAYHELGQLMLKIGEDDSASDAFRKGLTLSSGQSDLPQLEARR